jgi:hypothetical protein
MRGVHLMSQYTDALEMALVELKRVEWCIRDISDWEDDVTESCPICCMDKRDKFHIDGCTLAATIKRLEELGGESE